MVDIANSEFYTANVSTLTTDFNVGPYYDDYNVNSNYYRILFKPGFAVQARELTQIQSILQNQIQTFGQHLFKEGSAVLGGKFDINQNVSYVKVKDLDSFSNEVTIANFKDEIVTGQTTGIKAYVNLVVDGLDTSTNTKTLYVTYMSANPNTGAAVFTTNETLSSNVGTLVTVSSGATGKGSVFTVNEGVRFAKQHFIHNNKQSIVIDRYGTSPTCKVGFYISEDIINAAQDSSLLDPALEASNYAAPGADRFKLSPELQRLEIDEEAGTTNFVNLFNIRNGVVTEVNDRPAYNVLGDEIAKRTSDESGDYYVGGLNVVVAENLNVANNLGLFTQAEGGDANLLSIIVEAGTAYVKGYEINSLVSKYLTTNKSTDYGNVNSQIVSSKIGSYVPITQVVGSLTLDTGTQIDLYDTAQNRIANSGWSTTSQTGKKIGTARVKSLTYDTGTLGTLTGNLNLHIFDVQMLGTNAFSSVKSVWLDNATNADFGADIILNADGNAAISEQSQPLIYPTGSQFVKTIRSKDGSIDTTFSFKKTTDVTISTGGIITLSPTLGTGEIFPYGTGTLSTADKFDLLLSFNESTNVRFGVATGGGGDILNGSGFDTRLNIGDKIELSSNSKTYIVASVNSTALTVTQTLPTINGNTIYKAFKTGDIINLNGVGNTGVTRSVTSTSSSLSIDLKESFNSSKSGTISYRIARTTAKEIAKILRPSRYVQINCSTAGTTGPFNLGFSDVFKIRSIRKDTSVFTTSTQGTDVTSSFTFDNGQRDDFYGLASITPKTVALTGSDYLLIELDYFVPDFTLGVGYFSVDSYPVNDSNPTSSQITTAQIPVYTSPAFGTQYDLRNVLDFRPVYTSTAADSTTVSGASTNPADTTAINFDSVGLRIPAESEDITFDYSYYLSRIDMAVVDVTGTFSVIKGVSGVIPITPKVEDKYMSCARILITPYPSISLEYAKVLGRPELGCRVKRTSNIRYTMRDIGVLKGRIDNLEQYASLSLLEKNTIDLKILDENGLDRFKNGIFVDNFANKALSDITNPDWHICFDPDEFTIRPLFETQALGYGVVSNTNCVVSGDYIMLPYTETPIISQPYASTFRNVETTVYKFSGSIYLDPEIDFWTDTKRLSTITYNYGDQNLNYTPYALTYGSWQTVSGSPTGVTKTYTGAAAGAAVSALNPSITTYSISGSGQSNYGSPAYGNITLPTGQNWGVGVNDTATITTFNLQQARTITETFQYLQTNTSTIGDRVVDVGLMSDIRPQIIAFEARGLKANTRHYAFFDGQAMSAYVTPASKPISTYSTPGAEIDRRNFTINGVEGTALKSDANGVARGFLRLPSDGSKNFRVGSKEFILTDIPTNEDTATSYGKTYFVSYGIQQTKQETVLSTKKVVTEVKTNTQTQTVNKTEVKITDQVSCMAYSFIPRCDDGVDGIFLTSVDVYFAAKDPNLGIWFEIRAMDNAGNITRTQVPMSKVWLNSSQVNTSDDGSVATNVKFKTPIFLQNNVEYAFVIHTEGINPNYYMFVQVLGEKDILTKNAINQRQLTGSLYTTNNNLNWDIVQRTDLKCKFNRAKFTTNVQGTAILGNLPVEFLTANTVSSSLRREGEIFNGNDDLILSSISGGTITAGNLLIGQTSTVNTSVILISGSNYRMANNGFIVGETVVGRYASNGALTGVSATVASKNTASGMLYTYSDLYGTNKAVLSSSNGLFITGDTMRGTIGNQTFKVQSIDKFVYSTVQFEPAFLSFNKTTVDFSMRTVANNGTIGAYTRLNPGSITDFDSENAIFSRTNEILTLGQQSNRVSTTLLTTNEYVSPVIDYAKSYNIYVHNMINSNTTSEANTTGGGLTNKYVSQIVTLADGQDAEDLQIVLSAYRPSGSNANVHVWVRFSHAEDFESIGKRNWVLMDYSDSTIYSSLSNRKDFREYSFNFPANIMTGSIGATANVVTYTNGVGTTFTGFKQFQVKIGLQSDDSAIFPKVADLRVIALQK